MLPPLGLLLRPPGAIPQGMLAVDPNDPINDGLIACYLPGLSPIGLVGGEPVLIPISGTGRSVSRYGNISSPGTNLGYYAQIPAGWKNYTGALSISVIGTNYAGAPSASDAFGITYNSAPTTSWSAPYVVFYIRPRSASNVEIGWDAGGSYNFKTFSSPWGTNGAPVNCLATYAQSGTVYIYANGALAATAVAGSALVYGTTPYIFIGAATVGEGGCGAAIVRLWKTPKTGADASRLLIDPFAGLISAPDRLPVWGAVGGATLYFDFKLGGELLRTARRDSALAAEMLTTLRDDRVAGAELLRVLPPMDIATGAELNTGVKTDGKFGGEIIATVKRDGHVGSENLSSVVRDGHSAAEVLRSISASGDLAAEKLAGMTKDGALAAESLSAAVAVMVNGILGAELLSSVKSSGALGSEIVSEVVAVVINGALGAEFLGTVYRNATSAAETLASIHRDPHLGAEDLTSLRRDFAFAAENLRQAVIQAIPAAEFLAGISVNSATSAELLQLVRIVVTDGAVAAELRTLLFIAGLTLGDPRDLVTPPDADRIVIAPNPSRIVKT